MALFENFPYTNLHELNLNWLIQELKKMEEQTVISVNGQTGEVVLYTQATVQFPEVTEDHWSIIRMADGTTRGILFGNDDKAYIIHGGLMNQVYAQNNPPPYPVTSVNGQTGDVVLYSQQYVQLPALTDASMHSWSIFRKLNGNDVGIDFDDNGDAYLIDGVNRYKLFTQHNPPFGDSNGVVTFNPFTNPNYDGWTLQRTVNGTNLALTLNDDGTLTFKVGSDEYIVYTSYDGVFYDPTDSILEFKDTASDYVMWGLIRETASGKVGIAFDDTDSDAPTAWMIYVYSNQQEQTVQLLTTADIPSGAGVITINGEYGVVTLYSEDIQIATDDPRSIKQAIDDIIDDEYDMDNAMTYTERGNTASQNIPLGKYVIWNNNPYISIASIAIGDTLSASNLASLNHGIIDNLLGTVNSHTNQINNIGNIIASGLQSTAYAEISSNPSDEAKVAIGKLRVYSIFISTLSSISVGTPIISGFDSPNHTITGGATMILYDNTASPKTGYMAYLNNAGNLVALEAIPSGHSLRGSISYVAN